MKVRVLGTAAGGGVPQWNCRCANCQSARLGGRVRRRLQSSLAVSPNGADWYLVNATPDLREQLESFSDLAPGPGLRESPIRGVILTDAELDHTLGLLQLREGASWTLWATASVLQTLRSAFPAIPILQAFSAGIRFLEMPLDEEWEPMPGSGLRVRATEVSRRLPLYVSHCASAFGGDRRGAVVALTLLNSATGRKLVYAPSLRELNDGLRRELEGAYVVLLDGTFWREEELIELGISGRSAGEMDHAPVWGANGTATWLARLPAAVRRYVHVNNTNPALDPESPEAHWLRENGLDLADDGWEVEL